MKRTLFLFVWVGLLTWLAVPFAAAADEESIPTQPENSTDGLFLGPAFMMSTFVTDKGQIRRLSDPAGGQETLNVHTGDWNWIVYPSFSLGYDWGGWQGSMRAAYNVHLANFDLPYGHIADGVFTSLEVGPELYADIMDFGFTTLEAGLGVGARFLARGKLDYRAPSGRACMSRDFLGDSTIPGFSMHLGLGGELMASPNARLGWWMRVYYAQYTLESDQRKFDACADPMRDVVNDKLDLDVYSALFGVRLRIYPFAKSRSR
ncbi:MAG: hypothetical protein P9L99_05140 [Candidatus Lernaella stagnicola]|nr:hypothetical protein [Candidatus Lernaella stagnicola]